MATVTTYVYIRARITILKCGNIVRTLVCFQEEMVSKSSQELDSMLRDAPPTALRTQAYILACLWNRHSPDYKIEGSKQPVQQYSVRYLL